MKVVAEVSTISRMRMQKMSELEQQVMEIVWLHKACSVRCVMDNLQGQKKLAYTTVATLLQRLHDKGLVEKEYEGLTLVFKPKVSKSEYSNSLADMFVRSFIENFGDLAIASFADSIEKLPVEKRSQLLKMLEEHEK